MTPEQQRIAIAETQNYWLYQESTDTHLRVYQGKPSDPHHNFLGFITPTDNPLPDYPSDLNAMREAVRSRITSPILQQEYFYQLNDAIGLVDSFSPAWIKEFAVFAHSQATAAQRAEAFLRTLNLWKD